MNEYILIALILIVFITFITFYRVKVHIEINPKKVKALVCILTLGVFFKKEFKECKKEYDEEFKKKEE